MSNRNPPLFGIKEVIMTVALIGFVYFFVHKAANLNQPKEQLVGNNYKC